VPETVALIAQVRAGNEAAFGALVAAHLRPAYLAALAIVCRPSDADDVAQDAFLIAFERLDSCREPARFSGWLLRIVRNHALNWVARRRLHDVLPEPPEQITNASAPTEPSEPVVRAALLVALSTLTPPQREVVLLHEIEEWSHAEIAAALEISEVMSRQHLLVARRRLRENLTPVLPQEVNHGT